MVRTHFFQECNVSSILTGDTMQLGNWCKGSTRDFDSCCIGSIPVFPAK